ncbi:hypothetical protein JHJ32_12550 [Parapedobacter sp. ISTM3]|uniref:hypothetical protein n=1 Tax=Parapedobacter sp. ISTM3 TaxID=2800130 RepID=UPI0019037A77|nr:hypothetical protein [Parapedobacter sp. ISTM3]MBK1440821.1 hypothetical protein [Parapedobacter sp. ISTM3]
MESESKLAAIEDFIDQTLKKPTKGKLSINDFVGTLSKREADEMKKAIAETRKISFSIPGIIRQNTEKKEIKSASIILSSN